MKLSDIITRDVWNKLWAYVISMVSKTKTIPSWTMFLLNYIGQLIYSWIKKYFDKKAEEKQTEEKKKAKEVLDDKLTNPTTPVDETGKAYEDFINSGRK